MDEVTTKEVIATLDRVQNSAVTQMIHDGDVRIPGKQFRALLELLRKLKAVTLTPDNKDESWKQ